MKLLKLECKHVFNGSNLMNSLVQSILKPNHPIWYFKGQVRALFSLPDIVSEIKMPQKVRYDGRSKKRQWQERRTDKGAGLDPTLPKLLKVEGESAQQPIDKIKRRKFAVLMGYSGVGYYGMQRNPDTKTIEEELFKALLDSEFINEECYQVVQNMQFQRAARTDKGVSAARQVVSLKLKENFDISKVNEHLPEQIKLFAFRRVTKGFNSKTLCDGRTYMYVLPTVAFTTDDVPQKGFRISEEAHKKIKDLLQLYVGTKNYHNFTSKKKPEDPSSKRVIRSFICEPPFVKDDVEFCALKVYGQSFMMHQIRKMIGLLLAVMRGKTSEETLVKAFETEKINIPRAPGKLVLSYLSHIHDFYLGLGLLLDYVHYERYNYRYGEDGVHAKLTWEDVEEDVENFRQNHILPTILNTEINEEAMVLYFLSSSFCTNEIIYCL